MCPSNNWNAIGIIVFDKIPFRHFLPPFSALRNPALHHLWIIGIKFSNCIAVMFNELAVLWYIIFRWPTKKNAISCLKILKKPSFVVKWMSNVYNLKNPCRGDVKKRGSFGWYVPPSGSFGTTSIFCLDFFCLELIIFSIHPAEIIECLYGKWQSIFEHT